MENGMTLIIDGIQNDVDPLLDPILEKEVIIKGKTKFIQI